MKLSVGQWIAVVVLVVLGIYFRLWHVPPLPGNHEDIGLEKQHVVHAVIGVVLLIGAFLIIRRSRSAKPAAKT